LVQVFANPIPKNALTHVFYNEIGLYLDYKFIYRLKRFTEIYV